MLTGGKYNSVAERYKISVVVHFIVCIKFPIILIEKFYTLHSKLLQQTIVKLLNCVNPSIKLTFPCINDPELNLRKFEVPRSNY